MDPRLLGYSGLALATASTLLIGFTVGRLREPLLAFGDHLPWVGTLLVTQTWLAALPPLLTLVLLFFGRPAARRPLLAFVAGVASVLLALAWVGFGALLPLDKLASGL